MSKLINVQRKEELVRSTRIKRVEAILDGLLQERRDLQNTKK